MTKKARLIAAALAVMLGTAIGVGGYVVAQLHAPSHPPEETAKFVPMDTSVYVSMNLDPGSGQFMKANEIIGLFQENPKVEEMLDQLNDDIANETGIIVEEDVFPWLGREIALAIPTLEGIDEVPEFVGFIGTTDTAAAEAFVRKLLAFGEATAGTAYDEVDTRGYLTFVVDPSAELSGHIAVTDDYLVVAAGARSLRATLERMDASQDGGPPSLFDHPPFQKARDAAQSPRFGFLYVDIDVAGIVDELGAEVDDALFEGLSDLAGQLPDFVVVSSSFIDQGIRVAAAFEYPAEDHLVVPASANDVRSAELAPADTVALLSFVGVREAWARAREEFSNLPEFDVDAIEAELGIDLDHDIFGWMAGEMAVALFLPGGVSFNPDEIHANVYVEIDDRDEARAGMEEIQGALEDGGVAFRGVDIEGTEAIVADLGDMDGLDTLTPGYVVLGDYVVIGTTVTALRHAVDVERGNTPSLRGSSAFSRALTAAGTTTDVLVYGNIRRIANEALDQMDATELAEYHDTAEQFVAPMESFLLAVAIENDLITVSTVITFDAPTP